MPTRNVVLTDHQSALLDRLVAEGRYQNASEAMREGLRLIERDEDERGRLISAGDAMLSDLDGGNASAGDAEDVIRRTFDALRS